MTLAVLLFFNQGLCQLAWQQRITVQVNSALYKQYTVIFHVEFPCMYTLHIQILTMPNLYQWKGTYNDQMYQMHYQGLLGFLDLLMPLLGLGTAHQPKITY